VVGGGKREGREGRREGRRGEGKIKQPCDAVLLGWLSLDNKMGWGTLNWDRFETEL